MRKVKPLDSLGKLRVALMAILDVLAIYLTVSIELQGASGTPGVMRIGSVVIGAFFLAHLVFCVAALTHRR